VFVVRTCAVGNGSSMKLNQQAYTEQKDDYRNDEL